MEPLTPEQASLFEAHLPMCACIVGKALRRKPQWASYADDFEQEARIRLLWCVRHYDANLSTSFLGFAYPKVAQAVSKAARPLIEDAEFIDFDAEPHGKSNTSRTQSSGDRNDPRHAEPAFELAAVEGQLEARECWRRLALRSRRTPMLEAVLVRLQGGSFAEVGAACGGKKKDVARRLLAHARDLCRDFVQ